MRRGCNEGGLYDVSFDSTEIKGKSPMEQDFKRRKNRKRLTHPDERRKERRMNERENGEEKEQGKNGVSTQQKGRTRVFVASFLLDTLDSTPEPEPEPDTPPSHPPNGLTVSRAPGSTAGETWESDIFDGRTLRRRVQGSERRHGFARRGVEARVSVGMKSALERMSWGM